MAEKIGMATNLKIVRDEEPKIDFSSFWAVYPRRQARKDALKAWSSIDPVEYPKILRAVEQAKRSDQWTRDGGQYIPMPATYLRGERWNDEMIIEVSQPQPVSRDDTCQGIKEDGSRCGLPGISSHDGKKWYCRSHA